MNITDSIDQVVNAERDHGSFVYIFSIIVSFNGLLYGYDLGVISGALLYITETFGLSTFLQQVVTTSLIVGALVGAVTGGRIADRIGRRLLAILAAIVFFVGALAMAVAPSVAWLVAWRFITGLAVGFASVVGPLYISETAPTDIRGSLVFFQQLMITIGILLAYVTNYLFAPSFLGITAWRWMLGFGAVPALILGVGMYFMPESPRWLVDHDRIDEARETLSHVHDQRSIDERIDEIRDVSATESEGDFSDLLEPWLRPALVVGIVIALLQQLVGINTIIYYAPTILTEVGLGNIAALFGTILIGVFNVAMTVVAIVLVDRVGRRPLLLVGTLGMAIMLGIIGYAFLLPGLSGIVGYAALAGMILYVGFYAISLGPVFYLLISEIYPLQIRGTANGVANLFAYAGNITVALTFLSLINRFGQTISFWILGIISVIGFVYIYFRVPETMGRSLESIEADLRERTIVGSETDQTD